MINVVQVDDVYQISFRYDPELIMLVKNVPGRQWHPAKKFWSIPKDNLGMFINQVKGTEYEKEVKIASQESLNVNAELESTKVIPEHSLDGVSLYIKDGNTFMKHQLDFMKYALHRFDLGLKGGFILSDEQGLGKTLESINLAAYMAEHYRIKHCLVICCVNTSKYTWQNEIRDNTHGKYDAYILGTRLRRDKITERFNGSGKEKLEDLQTMTCYGSKGTKPLPFFILTNIESIRYREGKYYPIAVKIAEMCNRGDIGMIMIDEVHKNMSPTSQQGKRILYIKNNAPEEMTWLPITGTPIVNEPTDVFLPLKLVNGHHFSSYYSWSNEFFVKGGYGNHEIVGYKNIPRLKTMLQANMIRRLKSEVLDMPPKLYYTEYVENTSYQEKLYSAIETGISERAEMIVKSLNPLSEFLRLRQVNGSPELVDLSLKVDSHYLTKNAKMRRAIEIIEDTVARGEKIIVFSNWVEPLRTLFRFISVRYKTCVFTGTMKDVDRQANKKAFIEDPTCQILIGTIGALGTTHSFPGCKNMLFYDTPWTYVDRTQAEDRVHGLSRGIPGESVNYITLITKGTVDERVWEIMYDKKLKSEYIVDGKLDLHSNPDLIYRLLGR